MLPKKPPIHRQNFDASEPMERWITQDRVDDPPSIFHFFFEATEHKYTGMLDIECDVFKRI